MAGRIVVWIIAGALVVWTLFQCRKPSGPLGRLYLALMNRTHSRLTDWALGFVPAGRSDTILDIGCGGGRTIGKLLARTPSGVVHGIDYSQTSVAAATASNAREIAAGRVIVRRASVEAIPYPDDAFDVVTAVETHYYWPDLPKNLREVLRVVKPGGFFAIVAETYRGNAADAAVGPIMRALGAKYLTIEEHRNVLDQAGFVEVAIHRGPGSWLCATARKSAG